VRNWIAAVALVVLGVSGIESSASERLQMSKARPISAAGLPAAVERNGPIEVVELQTFGAPQYGEYYAYRFRVTNFSDEKMVVRFEVRSGGRSIDGTSSRARRSVQLAPRASAIVEIPQLLTTSYTADELLVEAGDRRERRRQALKSEPSWDHGQDVLAGRSVPAGALPLLRLHRTELAPAEWSTSWLQYSRFEAAVFTDRDWAELPPPVRAALLRWNAAGGWLLFMGTPEGLPRLRPSPGSSYGFHGLGRVTLENPALPLEQVQSEVVTWMERRPHLDPRQVSEDLPLLEKNTLPVRSLFGVLLAFVLIGGPLNLYALAKKNRRFWVFWTLPLVSLLASVALIGATLMDEGWVRIHRSRALTLLDETRGHAITAGLSGIYATMAPRGQVVFEPETEIRPMGNVGNGDMEWDDGQRLFGSWVGTRVPSYFALRRSESRRERLPVRAAANGLTAVNGLGAHIVRLSVADADGSIWTAANVTPGSEVLLKRTQRVRSGVPDIAERLAAGWYPFLSIVENDPHGVLRPGMYAAVIRGGNFLGVALDRPTTASASGVVIGWMKDDSDSSRRTP